MQFLSRMVLSGPNVWCRQPTVEVRVDCSGWPKLDAAAQAGFWRRLRAVLPELGSSRWPADDRPDCSAAVPVASYSGGRRRPAGRRLVTSRDPAAQPAGGDNRTAFDAAAQALLDVALALHARSRRPLAFARVMETCDPAVYVLVAEYEEAELMQACLALARQVCESTVRGETVDLHPELQRLRTLADDLCLGTTTGALVAAARQRGIPVRRLDAISLVQLGHGSRQRRMLSAITDQTGKIAEFVSLDKDLTKALLREVGVPVPAGRPVQDRDDAWRAACELGLPVVVKPRNGDYGLGVGLNLRTRDEVLAAYDDARHYRDEVIVETFVCGAQHRVTVVGRQMVAAVRRVPPQVVGDGVRSVAQLIDLANRDPRRGDDDVTPLNRICPDEDTPTLLVEQGLELGSVPPAGARVALSRLAHTWAGGEVADVTDLVHPEVAAQCVRAAQTIGIDVAGLDLIAEDIGRPLEEQGGVILEVNAGPAIALHFAPFCERPRPVCEAIVDRLFPQGQTGRISTVVVAGADDAVLTGRLLEQFVQRSGVRIGRAATDGLHVAGSRIKAGDAANVAGARALLLCPDVDRAIVAQSYRRIRSEGLCVEQCDVAVLAGVHVDDADAAELAGLLPDGAEADRLDPRAARVLIESVDPDGSLVIDAEDAVLLSLAAEYPGRVILVSDAGTPCRKMTMSGPCDAVCAGPHDGELSLWSGGRVVQVLRADGSRFARDTPPAATPRCLLRAVAAAWACGLSPSELQVALDSYPAS